MPSLVAEGPPGPARDRRGLDPKVGVRAMSAMMVVLLAALAAAVEADKVPMHEQLMQAGSRAFQTSLSSLWRGSDDLRFKTTYAGGTVLDGFICSDLIDIGGYSSLAPFGCITETSGMLDGAGIAGFGMFLFSFSVWAEVHGSGRALDRGERGGGERESGICVYTCW